MEYKMVTIPFDLETAKKINIGERVGQIVTEKGRNRAEIVYEDNSSSCPLLVVIHSISVSADWFSATGKALSSENRLLLEVPEYITFKDGEVLSNKDGSYIFILNTHGKYLTSFYASLNQKGILKIKDGLSEMLSDLSTRQTSKNGIRFMYNKLPEQDSSLILNRRSIDSLVTNMFKVTENIIQNKNKIKDKHIILEKQEF